MAHSPQILWQRVSLLGSLEKYNKPSSKLETPARKIKIKCTFLYLLTKSNLTAQHRDVSYTLGKTIIKALYFQ